MEHMIQAIVIFLLSQVCAGIAWLLKDNTNLKVSMAMMKQDLDAAHSAIRELKGRSK